MIDNIIFMKKFRTFFQHDHHGFKYYVGLSKKKQFGCRFYASTSPHSFKMLKDYFTGCMIYVITLPTDRILYKDNYGEFLIPVKANAVHAM